MTVSFDNIRNIRENVAKGSMYYSHLLAISLMDDYADVCMKATLNSIYVAFYKYSCQVFQQKSISRFDRILNEFKASPCARKIGETEAKILSESALYGPEFKRDVYRMMQCVYTSIASIIDKIIEDKWDDGQESASYVDAFRLFKAQPSFKTLVTSMNELAHRVKTTDFRSEALDILKTNSRNGYKVSKVVLDYLQPNKRKGTVDSKNEEACISEIPSILILTLNYSNPVIYTEGRIYAFEYPDLTRDIFKELCFVFADYLELDEIPINIITDFEKEDGVSFDNIKKSAETIADRLIADERLEDDVVFDFPDKYVKWLVYHADTRFKAIGEALRNHKLVASINLKDLFNEYLKLKVKRYVSDILDRHPEITAVSLYDRDIKASCFIDSLLSLRSGLRYVRWDSPEYEYIMANACLYGSGVSRDIDQGLACLRDSADREYAPARYLLGVLLRRGIFMTRDIHEAIKMITLAADMNYAPALYDLGQMYLQGEGLDFPSETKAAELFALAESMGNEKARIALAECYKSGTGVEKNDSKYACLVEKLTRSTDGKALSLVADAYYYGIGMPQDCQNGRSYYVRAAEAGDIRSQQILGKIYLEGIDVAVNYELAEKWTRMAADSNDVDAQYAMIRIGHSIDDDSICVEYLAKAINNGCKEALTDTAMQFFPKEIRTQWFNKFKDYKWEH